MTAVIVASDTLGAWIREARERLRLSTHECAVRAGVRDPVWSEWESDRTRREDEKPPQRRPETLRKIAGALGIAEWEVFEAAGYLPSVGDHGEGTAAESREIHDDVAEEFDRWYFRFEGDEWFQRLSPSDRIKAVQRIMREARERK